MSDNQCSYPSCDCDGPDGPACGLPGYAETMRAPIPMPLRDREYLQTLAYANGWTWAVTEGGMIAQAVRDNKIIRFWFNANDPDQLNCAEADHWKKESYGPAALRRTLREMKAKR